MITVVERDPTVAQAFVEAVGNADVIGAVEQVKAHLDTRPDQYAVVLGPSVPLPAAIALADTVRVTRPALSVILVRAHVDTSVLAEALRSGMREVVAVGELDALGVAAQRARDLHAAMNTARDEAADPSTGKLVTIFSAKGGVGKTTIATNLAYALAAGNNHEVCVVDLDLSFGDVAIALQIFPSRTIADTVAMQSNLDAEGLESVLTQYRDGVFALAAPVQPDARDAISASLVGTILQLLRQRFAYVVVDTPPALDDVVLQAFDESDLIVLVATPDIPALKNLKIASETMSLLNIPADRRRLVLNRADARVGVSADEVAASLQMQITSTIPSSRDVPASINRGELIYCSDPRHPVSQSLTVLTRDVVAGVHGGVEPTGAGSESEGAGKRRRGGLFARRSAAR